MPEALTQWFKDPNHLAIAGLGAAVLVLLIWRVARSPAQTTRRGAKRGPVRPASRATIERYVAAGNYTAAARAEQQAGNFEAAMGYYLSAQKLSHAAQMAQRLNRPLEAAEFYEKARDWGRAAAMYRQGGMERKAEELLRRPASAEHGAAPAEDDSLSTPQDRARKAERAFEDARHRARTGDPDAQTKVEELGRVAAEALLATGDTRRAAEVCRDAGLIDQAVNLFVNLLGDPGAAAPLLAERGDHVRAASLYEAAGQKERATAAWVAWSETAEDPMQHIDQVERLGNESVVQYLDTVVGSRPPTAENVDLHRQIAQVYERNEQPQLAARVVESIVRIAPAAPDNDWLQRLRAMPAPAAATATPEVAGEAGLSLQPPANAVGSSAGGQPEPLEPNAIELDDAPADAQPAPQESTAGVLDNPALQRLVDEVATAAAKEAASLVRSQRPSGAIPAVNLTLNAPAVGGTQGPTLSVLAGGGGRHGGPQVSLQYVNDSDVQAARLGPSPEQLRAKLQDQQPAAGNVSAFYQLGLAQLAAGQWLAAREVFQSICRVDPEYRDANNVLNELSRWQQAAAPTVFGTQAQADETHAGRYRLLGELGRGGMAVVYRAHDEALDRDVALKFLTEEVTQKELMLKLFQREARAAAQLNHPNIVTIYDVGTLNGKAFICMEYVQGVTVERLLEQQGRLRVLDTLRIAENILSGLEYAHDRNIIHRDIKPSNMMRSELGVVKLMDFGLAKSVEGQEGRTTMVAGTPSYMAPEQFTGKNVDATSDMFALGASLYEMLCGQTPYEGVIRDTTPAPVRELNSTVPKILEQLIMRSLEREQSARIKNAREMLLPIRQILNSAGAFLSRSKRSDVGGTVLGVTPQEHVPTQKGDAPSAKGPEGTLLHGTRRG